MKISEFQIFLLYFIMFYNIILNIFDDIYNK